MAGRRLRSGRCLPQPPDVKPTPTGAIIVDAMNGPTPACLTTGLNLVHVDAVAAGHRIALERGRIGEPYIPGCENLTYIRAARIVRRRQDVESENVLHVRESTQRTRLRTALWDGGAARRDEPVSIAQNEPVVGVDPS